MSATEDETEASTPAARAMMLATSLKFLFSKFCVVCDLSFDLCPVEEHFMMIALGMPAKPSSVTSKSPI